MTSWPWLFPLLLVAPTGADVLATYRGGEVTRAEYDSWLLANGLKEDEEQRRDRLEGIALSESLEAAALEAHLDREPQTAFRLSQIETGLLAAALRQSVDRAVAITDAEVEAELKAEDSRRYVPRTVRLRNIYKRLPADASEAVRAEQRRRMEDVRRHLLAGADFDDLAWRESDSQTRFRGGAMGYVPAGVLHPDVERIAFALKEGELSEVLASSDGFTILRCDDIDEGQVIPVEKARATIRSGLWRRASVARQAELRSDLLAEAAPRYAEGRGEDGASAVDFQGGRVTEAELRFLASSSGESMTAEARRRLLEEQVVQVTAARRARVRGLDQDPTLRAQVRWQRAKLLATVEMARRINATVVAPSDAEMRAHYERNRERYKSPLRVDVSLIRWPLEKAQVRARFADAEARLARLRAGEISFEQAARETSTHPSASAGGRFGLVPMVDLAYLGPNVYRTIDQLSPGETSGLVQQDEAIFVARLWQRRVPEPLAYDEVARTVEKELGDARVAALQKERETEARRALGLEMRPLAAP